MYMVQMPPNSKSIARLRVSLLGLFPHLWCIVSLVSFSRSQRCWLFRKT